MMFKILDTGLVRSNKLGAWESPSLIDYKYWDVRNNLPWLLRDPDALIKHVCDTYAKEVKISKLSQANKLSFYFYVKDELEKIAKSELEHFTPLVHINSGMTPSPRAKDYPAVLELEMLSQGCPLRATKIKELKYSDVFVTLLALVIKSEATRKEK